MDYTGIKQVQEIANGASNVLDQAQLVNAYLALGWMLIAIHQRRYSDSAIQVQTVYILGSHESDAQHPKTNHKDDGCGPTWPLKDACDFWDR